MSSKSFCSAIIVAAGTGRRMNSKINKQFIEINGIPILVHTLQKFQKSNIVDEIVLVTNKGFLNFCKSDIVKKFNLNKVSHIVAGGEERQFSVFNGLNSVDSKTDIVIIHDGVRPFVSCEEIEKTVRQAEKSKACILGVKSKDTIKVSTQDNYVSETLNRDYLWNIQTPQTFNYEILFNAYDKAMQEGFKATDDSMIVEKYGTNVKIIEGSYENIKITTAEDLILAKYILDSKKKLG